MLEIIIKTTPVDYQLDNLKDLNCRAFYPFIELSDGSQSILGSMSTSRDDNNKRILFQTFFPNASLEQPETRDILINANCQIALNTHGDFVLLGLGPYSRLAVMDYYSSTIGKDISKYKIGDSGERYLDSNLDHLTNVGIVNEKQANKIRNGEKKEILMPFDAYCKTLRRYIYECKKRKNFQNINIKL